MLVALSLIVTAGLGVAVRTALRPTSKDMGWCLGRGEPTGPHDLGTTGREITLRLADQHTTVAWEIDGQPTNSNSPARPCVLIVHGHTASRYQALATTAPLLPHASRVITFDLPGHGDATATTCTLGVREPADIAAIIHQVRQRLDETDPRTPLIVFGWSMGAQSALAAVANLNDTKAVAGLVLLGVYRTFAEPLPGHARRQGVPPWIIVPPTRAILRRILGPGIHFDRTADAAKLSCPLLLLHGEHDDLCPLPGAQALADAAHQANVETHLEVFRGGGHTRLTHTHTEQYTQTLAAFLQRFGNNTDTQPGITPTRPADDAAAPEPSHETP